MWRDDAWVLDMLLAARRALEHTRSLTQHEFTASPLHQDAIVRQLTILGEAAKRVSADYRATHQNVPWKKIAGLRDIIVHEYFRVDADAVWRILQEDLPALIRLLEPLVPPQEGQGRPSEGRR